MASIPVLPSQPLPRLFLMPVDSPLREFLVETHRTVEFVPAILDHIEADLDAHGLEKKLLREADRRFLEGQTLDLHSLKIELRDLDPTKLHLEIGRPRMEPYLVYLFLVLRGRFGGCKDQAARLLQEEVGGDAAEHHDDQADKALEPHNQRKRITMLGRRRGGRIG